MGSTIINTYPPTKKMFGDKEVLKEVWNGEIVYELENYIPYLKFKSNSSFNIATSTGTAIWYPSNNNPEYSTDNETWTTWDGTTTIYSGTKNEIYLRGKYLKSFGGVNSSNVHQRIVISGSNVVISGDIEGLLDYTARMSGTSPSINTETFRYLFEDNLAIVDASNMIIERTTMPTNYMESLFRNDTNLKKPPKNIVCTTVGQSSCAYAFCNSGILTTPKIHAITIQDNGLNGIYRDCFYLESAEPLDATTIKAYGCQTMFYGCGRLKRGIPLINKSLTTSSVASMYYGCTSLETLSSINTTYFATNMCREMYRNCTKIKISSSQSDEYSNQFRIPISGNGTTGTGNNALQYMFTNTGGPYVVTPDLNKIYYTPNEII